VEFRILGPLEVAVGSDRLELHGTRQQVVVATLLLSANRLVTMDRLLEAIYGEDLPPTARSQAQISVSVLRRLFASRSRDTVIATHPHGYLIRVGSEELDSQRFEELVTAARAARDSDNLDSAVARYRDAVRLWRGPALDGIDSQLVRSAASRLDEMRIGANEDRIALELDLGRHHELVGELTELVEEYPLRERLRGQLMLSLYRCDRAAEALNVYRLARRTMIEELGIDPSERLRQLEHAILTSDPSLDPPSRPTSIEQAVVQLPMQTAPNLLSADIADFTGRAEQIAQIHRHLVRSSDDDRLAVPVAVIVGKGGIGKTTLAVHAAHGVAAHFPDGQLFADLHGGGGSHPVSAMQVLERFLRALGVQGTQIPEGIDERAEVYRNLLADRKILVVLDDVSSESQVMPLLPGSRAAGVIITSRSRLAGLAGALRIDVDVFDADKSVELLARIAGNARVEAQSDEAAQVAEHCGHLPLALRIAGARLAARPHWSIQQLVERLADETRRLDELSHGEMGIRPSISFTYESTGEQARQLFRRLALLDMPVFSGWLSAALLGQPLTIAEDLLDDLITAQLIEPAGNGSGVHSQYRFHDLVRVFARERLAAEESVTERRVALERALGALLHLAEEAWRRYYGGDFGRIHSGALRWLLPERVVEALVADPLSWFDHERAALVSGVRQAAQAGFIEQCWSLTSSAVVLFESRIYLDDWRETHEIALEAARKAHDVRGEAVMLYHMGSLHITQLQFDQALRESAGAAELFKDIADDQGVALATRHIATIDRLSGRLDDAVRRYEQALDIFRKSGDHVGTAFVLNGLAQVSLEQGKSSDALKHLSEALRLCRATQCARLEAQVLHRLGEAYLLTGEPVRAGDAFEQALEITSKMRDQIGEAYALQGLGVANIRQSDFDQARSALQRAVELAANVGERMVEARALLGLGELALARRETIQALSLGQQAAAGFEEVEAPLYEAQAHTLLSDTHTVLGNTEEALAASAQASALRSKAVGDAPIP
jgi:DNA-binding SARP family transcriptional activator/Flp pilus assembly protein TadD